MITTSSIILRSRDFGEAHRIYTMYTEDHGKMEVVATGVRKTGSKFAGQLTEESILRCTVVPGRDRMRLVHVRREQNFPLLHENLSSFAAAHCAREMIDVMIRPGIADANIFTLLRRLFVGLEQKAAEPDLLLRVFVHHCLDALGLKTLPKTIQRRESLLEILQDHITEPFASMRFFDRDRTISTPAI